MRTIHHHISAQYCGFEISITLARHEEDFRDTTARKLGQLLDIVCTDYCCKDLAAIAAIEAYLTQEFPHREYTITTTYDKQGLCVKSSPEAT